MAKLTIDDLKKIKAETSRKNALREGGATAKITVHMGTCGIAAGAREVMTALLEALAQSDRADIRVLASGCLGTCSSEPNVTVEMQDREPIVYQKMESDRMRQVFERHVLRGEVQTDFVLRKRK
jgi:NADP-reducing hydrogenase subunit HndB